MELLVTIQRLKSWTKSSSVGPVPGSQMSPPDARHAVGQMLPVFACPGCRTNIQPPPGVAMFACPRCQTIMQFQFQLPPPPVMMPAPVNPGAQPGPSPQYVSEEESQVPYSANWSSPWRAFSPCTWDTNADHWQEPPDEPVLAPYIERFAYYICMRHELLRLVFVKRNDTLRRPDPPGVVHHYFVALHFTAQWSASTPGKETHGYNIAPLALQSSFMIAAIVGFVDVVCV